MSSGLKPGANTGNEGGIYQQQGPKGGLMPNYVTAPLLYKVAMVS